VYADGTGNGVIDKGEDLIYLVLRLGPNGSNLKLDNMYIFLNYDNVGQGTNFLGYQKLEYISNEGKPVKEGYISQGDLISISFRNDLEDLHEGYKFELIIKHEEDELFQDYLTLPTGITYNVTYLHPLIFF